MYNSNFLCHKADDFFITILLYPYQQIQCKYRDYKYLPVQFYIIFGDFFQ